MLYSEKVMDHFTHPRNVGTIENADGVGEVGNAKCGDIMKIFLKISKDGDRRRKVQHVRLWLCNCQQLNGYRDDQGQAGFPGSGAYKQGCC